MMKVRLENVKVRTPKYEMEVCYWYGFAQNLGFCLHKPGTGLNRRRHPFQNSHIQCFQQLQGLPWDCQTLESMRKTRGPWVIAVGDFNAGPFSESCACMKFSQPISR